MKTELTTPVSNSLLLGCFVAALVCCTSVVMAQDDSGRAVLEEIVVTAQQRAQSLADVPISVSVIGRAELQEQAIQKMADLQFSVPNFTMAESGIGTNVFIRGIGSGNNQGFEQSVGVYVDGIHHGRAQQARAPFFDLERVEVLRGPQSILFGKNSVAGALNLTTARPTDEFEGSIEYLYEPEDSEHEVTAVISGPLSDRVRYRLGARFRTMDGYIENLTQGRDNPEQDDLTIRATIEWDVSDDLQARLKVENSTFNVLGRNIEIGGEVPAAAGPFAGLTYSQILVGVFGQDPSVLNNTIDGIRHANIDFNNNEQTEVVLTLDWGIGEHTLTSITGMSSFEFNDECDCDFTGANVFSLPLSEEYDQFSQEFRLTSPAGENLDYIVGAFYQTSDHDYSDTLILDSTSILVPLLNSNPALPPGTGNLFSNTSGRRIATVDTDIASVFAQVNWNISDNFTLQLGGRLTHESKDGFRNLTIAAADGSPLPAAQAIVADFYGLVFGIAASNALDIVAPITTIFGVHPVTAERSETKFTPDVKLQWHAGDDAMFYASWVQGNKSGGFDFRANNKGASATMAEAFEFEDEEATNFEVGGKFGLAGGAAEINVAVFFTEFENLQVSIFDGQLGFNVGNAAKATVAGAELDGRWRATDSLSFYGSVAYTDFEFKDYANGRCNFGQAPFGPGAADGFCDYSGQTNQLASEWQGTLSVDHTYEFGGGMELHSSIDVFMTSDYHASASLDPALLQPGYSRINARIGLGNIESGWEVALLGENLSDETIVLFGGDAPLSGSTFGAIAKYQFLSRGRTVSLQVRKSF